MTERHNVEYLTDYIITEVNSRFPRNQNARLSMYETVADKLSGLVRALRGEILPEVVEADEADD